MSGPFGYFIGGDSQPAPGKASSTTDTKSWKELVETSTSPKTTTESRSKLRPSTTV